jgi:membrane-bound lytic murein transglycosylase D
MGRAREAGRGVVVFLLSFVIVGPATITTAFAQSPQANSTPNIESLIERAEAIYRQGDQAFSTGQTARARALFDQSVDVILLSGMSLRTHTRLCAYYRDLIDRIHKHEALATDQHSEDERQEIVEAADLDGLADVSEAELAAATADGSKIYGTYDFDFSVGAPVFQFISFFTQGRGRSTMEYGVQRSGRYRAMVEKIFKEERVPLDLIWLAQAESGWRPNALSRAAAKGIWQFVPSTGLHYGLDQTAWIDERSEPAKSTRAAARYLRWLHDHFAGDWLLAMAAYNSGENRIDSAIARCGYADFWELHRRGLIPQETRNYVPSILAIIIISKNQKRYGFDVTPDPDLVFDTYQLPDQTDLKVVADLLGVSYEKVQELNPELRRGVSPVDEPYTIKIPKGTRKQFEIAYAKLPEEKRVQRISIPAEEIAGGYRSTYRTTVVSYRVRKGDTLSNVARRNGLTVNELARINRLSTRADLRKGQSIRVPKKVRASRSKTRTGKYTAKHVTRSRHHSRSKKGAAKSSKRSSRRR